MEKIISLANYQIKIGNIGPAILEYIINGAFSKTMVLVDENTRTHCLPVLKKYLPGIDLQILEIQSGEIHKNIETCQLIWKQMMDWEADRKSLLINLGGGVIGDMGGFCAATFKRGIPFIQVPTTLLAQVDASIGGKLGIDFAYIKNSIGLFSDPGAVFIDPVFLETLSERQIRSGFAEIIKHSLIADEEQWKQISSITDLSTVDWGSILVPSLKIKQQIVEIDPFERNIRKALNFGHTVGHAIESYYLDAAEPLLHGEAIAAGMVVEAYLSKDLVGLSLEEVTAIGQFIQKIFGKIDIPKSSYEKLIHLMLNDKKNEGRAINFSCIQPIGKVQVNQEAAPELIIKALEFYRASRLFPN